MERNETNELKTGDLICFRTEGGGSEFARVNTRMGATEYDAEGNVEWIAVVQDHEAPFFAHVDEILTPAEAQVERVAAYRQSVGA